MGAAARRPGGEAGPSRTSRRVTPLERLVPKGANPDQWRDRLRAVAVIYSAGGRFKGIAPGMNGASDIVSFRVSTGIVELLPDLSDSAVVTSDLGKSHMVPLPKSGRAFDLVDFKTRMLGYAIGDPELRPNRGVLSVYAENDLFDRN